VAAFADPFTDERIALDRHRGREERAVDAVLVEEAQQPHDPGARSELVHGLRIEVAVFARHDVGDLGHPFVSAVAGRNRVFGSLFVVDDDVHRHLGVVRPDDLGNLPPVADELTLGARDVLVYESHATVLPRLET